MHGAWCLHQALLCHLVQQSATRSLKTIVVQVEEGFKLALESCSTSKQHVSCITPSSERVPPGVVSQKRTAKAWSLRLSEQLHGKQM